ncbi:hypothetical protein RFI_19297, partial [Reticulomyxa filosa]
TSQADVAQSNDITKEKESTLENDNKTNEVLADEKKENETNLSTSNISDQIAPPGANSYNSTKEQHDTSLTSPEKEEEEAKENTDNAKHDNTTDINSNQTDKDTLSEKDKANEVEKEKEKDTGTETKIESEKEKDKNENKDKEKEKEDKKEETADKEKEEEVKPEKEEVEPKKEEVESEKEKTTDTEVGSEKTTQTAKLDDGPRTKQGHVFTFGEKMIYKVDSIESGVVTCVRVSGGLEFPKGIFLTEEVLKTLKPSDPSAVNVEYDKGFAFEIDKIEYQVDIINENRATCLRTIDHDGSPEELELPLKQLEKLDTKPGVIIYLLINNTISSSLFASTPIVHILKSSTSNNIRKLLRNKSRVEEVKEQLESGDSASANAKIQKKRVSYVAEEVQVKTKASVFEEKAKEVASPKAETSPPPPRAKPGNVAARVAGLNIDPTKLKQGAYDAAKIQKKEEQKQGSEDNLNSPPQEINTEVLLNKGTVKSKRRPRTRKEVGVSEDPNYGPVK